MRIFEIGSSITVGINKIRNVISITFFALACFVQSVYAQKDWQLAKQKNGVFVFTKFYKDNGLKQLRAETTIDGVSLHTFVAIFKDIEHTKEWTANLRLSKCLKTINNTEAINYFVVDIPWPLRKREAIFKVNMFQVPEERTLIIESTAIPDFLPETDTLVRIYEAKAVWKFIAISDKVVKVESAFYADPRGFPPFLVNLFATDAPFQTLTKLREYAKKQKFKQAKFDFIKE